MNVMDRLRTEMTRFTTEPYLLTVTADRDPHCGTVQIAWDAAGERILVDPPSSWPGSAASGHHQVSLLWPPDEPGGYSLIIDGTAEQSEGDQRLAISASKAVLHRRGAPTAATTSGCASDCIPIFTG